VVEDGDTVIEEPVPTAVPLQLPEYQCHVAPVPNEPPDKLNVVGFEGQIGLGLALALVAAVDKLLSVTDKQVCALVPQAFTALTQILPALPGVALMVDVPCPEFMVQPAGTVHV
jgi:hypothetical protein